MSRRSAPSAKRDDDAFPIRIKLSVPPDGLGKSLDEMVAWLKSWLPKEAFAVHSARVIGRSATAMHFTNMADAAALLKAFQDVPLAIRARW